MTSPIQQSAAPGTEPPLARDLLYAVRCYLLNRTGLFAIGAVAVVAGGALNWDWLVASGIAPILITLLPCAVMCGVGLCAHRFAGGSCAEEQSRPTVGTKWAEEQSPQLDLFEPIPLASARGHEQIDAPEAAVAREAASTDEGKHPNA